MSDKTVMTAVFTLFTGAVVYHFATTPTSLEPTLTSFSASTAYGPSVAVVECQDCMESVGDSCEMESNECSESASCEEWMSCTQDCISLSGDQDCFDDCDIAHSDVHSQCNSLKTCMCDVCVGQCVDMCLADG